MADSLLFSTTTEKGLTAMGGGGGKGGKGDTPDAPDYEAAAVAQGQANKEAAVASSLLNNPNVVNPYGTQTWTTPERTFDQAGYDKAVADYESKKASLSQSGDGSNPFFGAFIEQGLLGKAPDRNSFYSSDDVSRPTLTQTLSPEQQALYDKQTQAQLNLGDLSIQGSDALRGVVGKELDLSGAPAAPGDSQATRDAVINAMMSRVNEDYGRTTDQANSDLIAAGIRPGSKAYDDRMALIERGRNDARQQAIIAGGSEAQRDFTMDTQARKDAIAEILAQRQTPLNEINALMSGSQVSNPFAVPGAAQNSNIAPAPLFGAAQAQYGAEMDKYNAQQAGNAGMMSGLFSLGSAGIQAYPYMAAASDRRLKSNIERIGDHPLGIGIYAYDIFGKRDVGVMADEVLAVKPEAVLRHPSGYLMVDYGALQ